MCRRKWRGYASSPSKFNKWTGYTNKIANFRGTGQRIGNKAKQRTKQAKAATLQAPKTSSRSHRLTNARKDVSVKICARVGQRRGGMNGRVHDPMHVMITATLEVWVLSQARCARLEEEGRYVK